MNVVIIFIGIISLALLGYLCYKMCNGDENV